MCVYVYVCIIYTYTHIPNFAYPFTIDEYLSSFYILAIMNNATMNTNVWTSLWDPAFSFFLSINPEVELLDHMYSVFNFLRKHYSVFHSSSTILYSHQ